LASSGAIAPFVGGKLAIFVPSCAANAWRVAFATSSDATTYGTLLDAAGDAVIVASGTGRSWCLLPYVPTPFLRLEVASANIAVMSCLAVGFR
jgi:hypothetical protein